MKAKAYPRALSKNGGGIMTIAATRQRFNVSTNNIHTLKIAIILPLSEAVESVD